MACQAEFTMSGREILRSDLSGLRMTRSEGLAMTKEGEVRMTRWLNKQSYVFQPPCGEAT